MIPKTYHDYTTRRVLTAEWIDGEKLSQSTADDVGDLVGVGVIAYLKCGRGLEGCNRLVHHTECSCTLNESVVR